MEAGDRHPDEAGPGDVAAGAARPEEAARGRGGVLGAILAGGRSSRMGGGDKALLPLGGRPLVAHVAERLAPQVGRLILNANGDPARFAFLGLPVRPDPVEGRPGPLAGLLAALEAAEAGEEAVVTAPADSPFIPADLVARLCAERRGDRPVVARSEGGVHAVAALWPAGAAAPLRAFLTDGERKVRRFAEELGAEVADFPPVELGGVAVDPFLNLNTPADLARAESLLAAAGEGSPR